MLAATQSHQHFRRLQHESERAHVLQPSVLFLASCCYVICHLQSVPLRVAERKFPQGIQADSPVSVRQHFNASRAQESEEFSQLPVTQEERREFDTQR